MSGHSKWAKIHRNKGVADAKRGTLFTKLGKTITVAAKEGGGDPETNFKLRLAVDKARAQNMPKENIERAIKRGTGGAEGGKIETIMYEGFGPGGSAFIVECLTDNRNRTGSVMKHLFSKYGGGIGSPNSVLWQFKNTGTIGLSTLDGKTELELIDLGATDIERKGDITVVSCEPAHLEKLKRHLEEKNIPLEFSENDLVPQNKIVISDKATKEKIDSFISEIEDNEDANNYFTNAEYE